jgi:hypothetical protein
LAASFSERGARIGAAGHGNDGERALPVDELVITAAGPARAEGQPEQMRSVHAALAAHPGHIFVLPSGRRIPVETLLDHLMETGGGGDEWAGEPCEVHYAAVIEPWATPSSAPCWERMRGPLWHLWSVATAREPRKLIGLIIADQRTVSGPAAVAPLEPAAVAPVDLAPADVDLAPADGKQVPTDGKQVPADERPAPPSAIELSGLVVEGEYHPGLAADDPAIVALTPPGGEGWQPRWWKLGSRPLWQYGWWR